MSEPDLIPEEDLPETGGEGETPELDEPEAEAEAEEADE